MKRIGLVLGIALAAGCSNHSSSNNDSGSMKSASMTPSGVMRPIFEFNRDDKLYVFGSADDLEAFQHGKGQAMELEKPNFTPKGKTAVFEGEDSAEVNELMNAYQLQHPMGK